MECVANALLTLCRVYVILNESVKLSADRVCTAQFSLIHRLTDDSPRTVATLVTGVWTAEDRYTGRVEHNSTLSLWLNRVNYSDNGYYEFTCAGQVVTIIELEVLLISNNNLSVTEGDTVTLPCYFQTLGNSVDSFEWERNGELVMNLSLSSGGIRYGTGFEGRVSVRSDRVELGELSLTVEGVQPEDRGDFNCFVGKSSKQKRERGSPTVVRVTVNERKRGQTTSAPVPSTHEEKTRPQIHSIVITAFVTFFITAALFGLLWYLRNRDLSGCARADVETPQREEDIPLRTTSISNGSGPPSNGKGDGGMKRTENQTVQQNTPKTNGTTDFINGSKKVHP